MSFDAFMLSEGGKVFNMETKRVSAAEAAATIKHLYAGLLQQLDLVEGKTVQAVGSSSAGKEAGDIDFIYDLPAMRTRLGAESCERRFYDRVRMEAGDMKTEFVNGFGITSIEYPVAGEEDKGHVQVDLIPVENMEWARFTYGQSSDSQYKSAHRNWLFSAMCGVKRTDIRKADGHVLSWNGYMFDIQRGFFKIQKSLEGVNGNLLKNPKKLESKLVSTDPDEFLAVMFDSPVRQDQVESFENTWSIILKDDKWKDELEPLAKELDKFLRRADLVIPVEIKEYL